MINYCSASGHNEGNGNLGTLKTLVPSQIGICGGAPASVSEPTF